MPSVTFDGRSFMLDGRRIWLVGGTVQYTRVPREHWADRIHAAKLLGVNLVQTSVVWSRHEPRPGVFDFKGDNDLRHFVQLVGAAGMYCVLRMGPFVGDSLDMGGLPAWVLELPGVKLRTNNAPYLEASSRFLTAVSEQLRDLQVTSPGKGGPVLMVQNESAWTCGDDAIASGYLGELIRYQREGGLNVPVLNANNLWQSVEGEIDCWSGSGELLGTMRQLGAVRSDRPKMVAGFEIGARPVFGRGAASQVSPWLIQRRLAEVLAGGAQYVIDPATGGGNFGFSAGRDPDSIEGFFSSSDDGAAPVLATGAPGAAFHAVRRITTFAARFGRLFANLDPAYQPVVLDPGANGSSAPSRAGKGALAPTGAKGVVHINGSQGGVVFVFADEASTGAGREATLLMPDGSTLPVHLGQQAVAWCVLDVQIGGRYSVDYCNLCALASVGRVFVCFGPAGSRAVLSVNGSPLETLVPTGKAPTVIEHEGLVVVLCSEEQVDQVYVSDDAVYHGVAGLTTNGKPLALAGARTCLKIASDGAVTNPAAEQFKTTGAPGPIALSKWTAAGANDYVDGSSARFASIPGPGELGKLGAPYGYGWYRLAIKSSTAHRAHVRAPGSGDRLHMFLDGEPLGVLGVGPGANEEIVIPLKKQQNLVVLAENAGRFSGGANLGEAKGLVGHLLECDEIKPGRPRVQNGQPIDPLTFRSPLWELRPGDATLAGRLTWAMPHRKKGDLLVVIRGMHGRGLLLVNEKPIAFVDRSGPASIVIPDEQLGRGNATIQLALLPEGAFAHGAHDPESLLRHAPELGFYEVAGLLTAKAEWSFAKWDAPAPTQYEAPKARGVHVPAWWKSTFTSPETDAAALLELGGVTKGQVYINGKHLGRYFVATGDGKSVSPAERLFVPRSWLRPGAENEVVIFDEHGGNPGKCRIVFDAELPIVARFVPDPPAPPPPPLPPAGQAKPAKGPAKAQASAKPTAQKATAKKK